MLSVVGTVSASIVGLGGSAEMYVLDVTTRASIDSGAVVNAVGSVLVEADDDLDVDFLVGTAEVAPSFGANAGGSAGLALIDKTTEAYVGEGAHVTAQGLRDEATGKSGGFTVSYQVDPLRIPGLVGLELLNLLGLVFENPVRQALETAFDLDGDLEFLDLTPVDAPPASDLDYALKPVTSPTPQGIRGLSVTATSRDDVAVLAAGYGSGIAAAQLSVGGVITSNETRAYLGKDARINEANGSASAEQDVRVAAGSDERFAAAAGAAALSNSSLAAGTIGLAANLAVFDDRTEAFVGPNAQVNVVRDLQIRATATEDALVFAASGGAGSGLSLLNAGGSLDLVSVRGITHAFVCARFGHQCRRERARFGGR